MHHRTGSTYLPSNPLPGKMGGALTTLKIQLRWSTMNTTIHKMMGAIGSGNGQWLLTAALAYGGKVAVVKMVSGSGGGGQSGRAHNNQ
jgi:hypothetical protein